MCWFCTREEKEIHSRKKEANTTRILLGIQSNKSWSISFFSTLPLSLVMDIYFPLLSSCSCLLFVLQREFVIYRSSSPSVDDNIRHRDRKEWHHVWVRLWREYGSAWKTSCYWERSLSTSYFSSRGCFSLKRKWLQLLNVSDWDFAFHYILLLHSSISHSRLDCTSCRLWENIKGIFVRKRSKRNAWGKKRLSENWMELKTRKNWEKKLRKKVRSRQLKDSKEKDSCLEQHH